MKLLIVIITYNRLEYTKRTLQYLKDTLTLPAYIIAVDNASTDGTQKYLRAHQKNSYLLDRVIENPDNYYPGKATNIGWYEGLQDAPDTTHLMRLDNDMMLRNGWDVLAESYFKRIPQLGQLGLDHEAIEHPKAKLRELEINGMVLNPWPGCVGGPNIIRREVWEKGARYPELMWNDGRQSPLQEDSQFSKVIQDMGYLTGHMTEDVARTFANESNWTDYPEYYKKTMTDRGYFDNVKKLEGK